MACENMAWVYNIIPILYDECDKWFITALILFLNRLQYNFHWFYLLRVRCLDCSIPAYNIVEYRTLAQGCNIYIYLLQPWYFCWNISASRERSVFSHIVRLLLNAPSSARMASKNQWKMYCNRLSKNIKAAINHLSHSSYNMGMIFYSHTIFHSP